MAISIVFFLLFAWALAGLVAGLIKPRLVFWKKKRSRRRVAIVFGSASLILMVTWIVSLPTQDTPPPQSVRVTSNNTVKVSSTKPRPVTLKRFAESTVHQVIPSSSIMKNGDAFLGFTTDNKQIILLVEAEDNLSNKLITDGILSDTSAIMKKLFQDRRVNDVLIDWYFPVTDAYGNETNQIAVKVEFTRQTYNRINWSNFIWSNIPQIADFYQASPAYSNS